MSPIETATVIYDGSCNVCSTFIRLLEDRDRGEHLRYVPMQHTKILQSLGVTPQEIEMGLLLLYKSDRWQGTEAIETIGRLFPELAGFVALYRIIPGIKPMGDWGYAFLRDHRYTLFGKCPQLYESAYPFCQPEQPNDQMA